jgi:hypothetical protein
MKLFDRLTQIPYLIQDSAVFKELIDEKENSLVPIAEEYYFKDIADLFTNTLPQILNILRYWDINPLPYEVLDYVIKNKEQLIGLDKSLINYFLEITLIVNAEDEDLCREAAAIGSLNLLRIAHENGYPWDESVCTIAAVNGHLKCLIYAYNNSAGLDDYIYSDTLKAGHRDCFKYVASLCGLKYELNHMYEVVEYE